MESIVSKEPTKFENLPVYQHQLESVRRELKSDIATLRLETKEGFQAVEARFTAIDGRFTDMEARFTGVESRFQGIDSQFTGLNARFERIESILWGMKAMMEEQNTKILYALDGYNILYARVDRSETRIGKVEQKLFGAEQN